MAQALSDMSIASLAEPPAGLHSATVPPSQTLLLGDTTLVGTCDALALAQPISTTGALAKSLTSTRFDARAG